jgi:hypothetical protein
MKFLIGQIQVSAIFTTTGIICLIMPDAVTSRLGIDGRACVLRAICEAADTTFQYNGLAGEVLHVLLT